MEPAFFSASCHAALEPKTPAPRIRMSGEEVMSLLSMDLSTPRWVCLSRQLMQIGLDNRKTKKRFKAHSMNVLFRCVHSTFGMTSTQKAVDQRVESFVRQTTDIKSIASMAAGGMAYRVGRVGVMSSGVGAYCNTPLRVVSVAAGLFAEVSTFELAHRLLHSVGAGLVSAHPGGHPQGVPLHPEN